MTTIFEQLKFGTHPSGIGGSRAVIDFPNGYGASVISGPQWYTDESHPYELAVLQNGSLTYETPITDDVIGHLTEGDVELLLARIKELPEANPEGSL